MKKSLCFFGACILCVSSIFAGPFSNLAGTLNSFDSGASKGFEGTIPEGQELFPIIYRYTHDEIKKTEKILAAEITLKDFNVLENTYVIYTSLIYKATLGAQYQDSMFDIKIADGKFNVTTTYMVSGIVDRRSGEKIDPVKSGTSTMNKNSQNIVADLQNLFSATTGDDYNYWADLAYSDLETQILVGEKASNKLKAKKWYENHPIEGKKTGFKMKFWNINESVETGYAYQVIGYVSGHADVRVCFYTNDDKFIDLTKGDVVDISGTIQKVEYYGQYNTTDEKADFKNLNSLTHSNESDAYKIKELNIEE